VSYAHRKLVVHLDLKPSNVLVSSEGEVKLLDFGIARHLSQEGNASVTGTAHALLSLSYASPEQILGGSLDVQTDVFALGVLLYELLVGVPPLHPDAVRSEGLAAIVEQEIRPPSLVAREKGDAPVHASRAHWKDLDAICLKAASRDKATRYTSVVRLAADIDHFLKDEPIEAPTRHLRLYRARKFVRRHRVGLAAVAAVVVAVSTVALFYNVRLIAARNLAVSSEARMQRIYQVMVNLFEGDDSTAGPSEGLRVVSLLDRGAQEAEGLDAERELQAELRYTFGGLYHKLGHLDRAEPLLRASLASQRLLYGTDDPRTLKPQLALVMLKLDQSETDEAKQLAEEALALARRRYAPDGPEVATSEAALGKVFSAEGKYADALPLLERAVRTLSAGQNRTELSDALGDYGNTLYYTGQIDAAEKINQQALALDRNLYGGRHPSVAVDLFNLGNIALDHADYAASEQLFREALEINDAWYGPDHPRTASNVMMLGRAASYVGHASDAAALYERALTAMQKAYGDRHVRVAAIVSLMGDLALTRRQWQEAGVLLERARSLFKETVGEEHEFYLHMGSSLGAVQTGLGEYSKAVSLLQPAVNGLDTVVPDSRYAGVGHVRLAAALAGLERYADAERHVQRGLEILRKVTGPASVELAEASSVLTGIPKHGPTPARP
jgi:serine/threonine-protein kinase